MAYKKTQVLIVEDELALNEAYTRLFEAVQIDTFCAYNGKEALCILRHEKPDVILLDLRMPVMDGIAFLKALNPVQSMPETRIIVFSNYDSQPDIDKAFELGASHYMLKAWATPNELIKLIRKVERDQQKAAALYKH